MKRVLSTVVAIAVILTVMFGLKFYNKGKTSKSIKEQALTVIETIPTYEEHSIYLQELLDRAHPDAFAQSYKMGGRRTAAKFDNDRYLSALFSMMNAEATKDGHTEVANSVEAYRLVMGLPSVRLE